MSQELAGWMSGKRFYRMNVPIRVYHRMVTLSRETDTAPDWMDLGQSSMLQHRVIAISDPDWLGPMLEQDNE